MVLGADVTKRRRRKREREREKKSNVYVKHVKEYKRKSYFAN